MSNVEIFISGVIVTLLVSVGVYSSLRSAEAKSKKLHGIDTDLGATQK